MAIFSLLTGKIGSGRTSELGQYPRIRGEEAVSGSVTGGNTGDYWSVVLRLSINCPLMSAIVTIGAANFDPI